jgi:UDP-N-acetylbacillosamine N-acetyltransferase
MANPLVIWGTSGQALVVADIVRLGGAYEIVGFLDDVNLDRRGTEFSGATVLGGREQLAGLMAEGVRDVILAFGNCQSRLRLADEVRAAGFRLATVIHPRATVAADAMVGEGTVVAAGAVVNPAARIGDCVIVNTGATVDHHCVVHDGAHICPGVHIGGWATIGRAAWVGIGATVSDRVSVGAAAVVGAGSVVVRDVPADVVAYGVPARVIRPLESKDDAKDRNP